MQFWTNLRYKYVYIFVDIFFLLSKLVCVDFGLGSCKFSSKIGFRIFLHSVETYYGFKAAHNSKIINIPTGIVALKPHQEHNSDKRRLFWLFSCKWTFCWVFRGINGVWLRILIRRIFLSFRIVKRIVMTSVIFSIVYYRIRR